MFFLLPRYYFLINVIAGYKTIKLIFRVFVELHFFSVFLVVATVDSYFQELQLHYPSLNNYKLNNENSPIIFLIKYVLRVTMHSPDLIP